MERTGLCRGTWVQILPLDNLLVISDSLTLPPKLSFLIYKMGIIVLNYRPHRVVLRKVLCKPWNDFMWVVIMMPNGTFWQALLKMSVLRNVNRLTLKTRTYQVSVQHILLWKGDRGHEVNKLPLHFPILNVFCEQKLVSWPKGCQEHESTVALTVSPSLALSLVLQ